MMKNVQTKFRESFLLSKGFRQGETHTGEVILLEKYANLLTWALLKVNADKNMSSENTASIITLNCCFYGL